MLVSRPLASRRRHQKRNGIPSIAEAPSIGINEPNDPGRSRKRGRRPSTLLLSNGEKEVDTEGVELVERDWSGLDDRRNQKRPRTDEDSSGVLHRLASDYFILATMKKEPQNLLCGNEDTAVEVKEKNDLFGPGLRACKLETEASSKTELPENLATVGKKEDFNQEDDDEDEEDEGKEGNIEEYDADEASEQLMEDASGLPPLSPSNFSPVETSEDEPEVELSVDNTVMKTTRGPKAGKLQASFNTFRILLQNFFANFPSAQFFSSSTFSVIQTNW
ncbi:unnamed protein product [Protopolystoma xenopodis]|uniref:Uncharacterized protein n=1 Tax=Protopolystoma xenopodis TaxID=117903 RepID=A0A3S5CM31_9PLAT|nr:unnamed protein product [Protopolystoma xenopodis]